MWNYENLLPDLMIWLLVAGCSFWAMLNVYELCFRYRGRVRANRAVVNAFLVGRNELLLRVPPPITYAAARGRHQGPRVQLALVDRQSENLDNPALRELPTSSIAPSMTDEETKTLPVHMHRVTGSGRGSSSALKASSSSVSSEECMKVDKNKAALEDELICNICLEFVRAGQIVHCLPCLHQFHGDCIGSWLRTCPVCPICKVEAVPKRKEVMECGTSGDGMF